MNSCYLRGMGMAGVLMSLVLSGLTAGAGDESPIKEIQVPVCDVAPKLDTDLNDPAWQSATKLAAFYQIGAEMKPVDVPITAWLCRDETWLYIAFRCLEPKPATVQRQVTERDGAVSNDDSIEVFIDPGTGGTRYYQFMLTAGNVQADQACVGNQRTRSWNLPWRSAARLDPHIDSAKGWSAELAIPLAPLQAAAGTNQWRINLCRTRKAVEPAEFSSLAKLPPRSGFHTPEAFIPVTGLTGFKAPTVFGPMVKQVKIKPLRVEGDQAFYGVEVVVGNDSGKTGAVEVVVQDQPLKGTGTQGHKTLNLNPMDEQTVNFRIDIPDISRRDAWVGLREPGSDQWMQKMEIAGMELLSPFEAYVERNYYTTEKEARVWVEMRVGREERERAGFAVKVELLGDRGQVLAKNQLDCDAAEVAVPLKIAKLAPGTYPVKVSLLMKKQGLGHQEMALVKVPPAPEGVRETKIDRYNRCLLIDGTPFFPVGACGTYYNGKFEGWKRDYFDAQYRFCREAGLNVVMDWTHIYATAESAAETRERYDMAAKYGLKIIGKPYAIPRGLYYGSPNFREAAEKVIAELDLQLTATRAHPATIAYYHFDEPQPGLHIDDILESYTRKVHSLDPWHPVYMSLTRYIAEDQKRWFGTVTDLLGAHNYWYVMKPESLNANAESFEMVDVHARKAHSPTMDLPQLDCWGQSYGGGGFMTPHEQRAQTYFALIHGAKSVIYFCMPWKHQLSVATQKQISAEVQAMAPALLARDPKQAVTFEPKEAIIPPRNYHAFTFPITQVALREEPAGDQVLLAINASHDGEVTTRFAVSSLTGQSAVEGFFDRKPYPVTDGAFTDTIEPWGTRVYRLKAIKYDKDVPIKIHLTMSGAALTGKVEIAVAPPVYGTNLAVNPGFETNGAWGKFEAETNNPHSGSRALRLTKKEAGGGPVEVICEPIPLKPGTSYRFGGWVRADITEGRNLPTIFVHSSTRTAGQFRLFASATCTNWSQHGWQELSRTFTSPTGAAESVWIYLRIPGDAAGEACFDDISLQEVQESKPAVEVAAKKNQIHNSSFERARMPGHPDYWGANAWDILPPDPRANGLETNNPFHGKYCFRIAKPNAAYENFAYGDAIAVKPDRPYTLSFYIRVEQTNAVIHFYLGGPKEFKADTAWKRFTYTFTPTGPGYCACIYPMEAGMFYIDAVQLEEGTAATEYEPD